MWDHLNEMSPGFTFQRSCRQCGRRPALPSQLSGGKLSKVWKAERQRERDRERGIREWSLPTLWWWTWPVTYIAAIIWLETQEARQVNICNYRRSWQPYQGTPSELEATPGPLLARTESSPGCVTSAVVILWHCSASHPGHAVWWQVTHLITNCYCPLNPVTWHSD